MDVTIRKASHNDLKTLYTFEQQLILAERPFDENLREDPLHYYDIPFLIDSSDIEFIVAETDNNIIGCGYARKDVSKHYHKHEHHAYLGFMYVDHAYRGQGVNKKIMEYLAAWANECGLYELRLEVYADNISAIKAYEKAGFSSLMIQMRKSNF